MVCNRKASGGRVVGRTTELDIAGESVRVGETWLVGAWEDENTSVNETDTVSEISDEKAERGDGTLEEKELSGIRVEGIPLEAVEVEMVELTASEIVEKLGGDVGSATEDCILEKITETERVLEILMLLVGDCRATELELDESEGKIWVEETFTARVKLTVTWGVGVEDGWTNLVV